MIQKSCLFAAILLLYSVQMLATPQTDSLAARVDSLGKAVGKVQDSLAAALAEQRKKDSVTAQETRASFSKGVENWNKDKAKHYEKPFWDFNWMLAICIMVTLLWFFIFGGDYSILRDESFETGTDGVRRLKAPALRPYSYSRVQCLYWTMIIFSCYVSSCLYFRELMPLNETVIILLGGGLAVSVFGKVIDNSQIEKDRGMADRHQDNELEVSFFNNILSDETGVSVHRLQAVLFNIVFGIGYIAATIGNIAGKLFPFPDFELWQFSLLGISAAGYLGMKAGENSDATKAARSAIAKEKMDKVNALP